ncbi:MAG: hypothetical protein QXF17_03025 [Ignisphaera sp.]
MVVESKTCRIDEIKRLKIYVDFCISYIGQDSSTVASDRSFYYIIRYLAIVISRLISTPDLAMEISKRCQGISTLIDIGKAFLQAKYSYTGTDTVYTVLKTLCPCIKESIL